MEELFWQFLLYSFLGFVLEVLFARIARSGKPDRKCLFLLPLCPVYGLGALLINALPPFVRYSPLLLLPFGAIAASAAEYFMGWFYERILGVQFWDYSAMRWNLNGRICLAFSLAWGLISLVVVSWIHPRVLWLISQIPASWTLPATVLFAADTVCTIILLRSTRTTASLRWYDRLRRPEKKHS